MRGVTAPSNASVTCVGGHERLGRPSAGGLTATTTDPGVVSIVNTNREEG